MNRLRALAAVLLSAQCLPGCGQTGPLYLPGAPSEMRTPPAEDRPAESFETPAADAEEDAGTPSAVEEVEDDSS